MSANARYPRVLKGLIARDLEHYPVVAVMGARQVGKSTLCQELAGERGMAVCTLDDRVTLEAARQRPDDLLASFGEGGAFIDEAQRAPGILLAIKARVDRQSRSGLYLLSGSNQPQVSAAVGDSLLGRAVYRTLRPLILSELRFDDTQRGWSFLFERSDDDIAQELARRREGSGALDWRDVVSTGGFPRVVTTVADQRLRLLDAYVGVFVSRDIREVIGIDAADRFEPFLRLVAARVGQLLNYSGLSADLGISVNTVRRWIDALRRSYLIELIPQYFRNAGHRVIKAPKLFAVDAALALAAARESEPSGFHLENLVATDLAAWADGAPTRAVYHWRVASGQEVDFVAEEAGALMPIEVKTATTVDMRDAKHLRTFLDRHPSATRALLLSGDPFIGSIAPRIVAAPWWAVL